MSKTGNLFSTQLKKLRKTYRQAVAGALQEVSAEPHVTDQDFTTAMVEAQRREYEFDLPYLLKEVCGEKTYKKARTRIAPWSSGAAYNLHEPKDQTTRQGALRALSAAFSELEP